MNNWNSEDFVIRSRLHTLRNRKRIKKDLLKESTDTSFADGSKVFDHQFTNPAADYDEAEDDDSIDKVSTQ